MEMCQNLTHGLFAEFDYKHGDQLLFASQLNQLLVCLIKTELTRGRQDVTAQQGPVWLSIHTATAYYSTGLHTEPRVLLIVINRCSPPRSLFTPLHNIQHFDSCIV